MDDGQYEGIAIIGMAGRFPGANGIEEFWENLVSAKETVSFFTDEQLAAAGLDPAELRNRGHYVAARGVLEQADGFDAAFFGIHPKEAEVMDPQQRVFLEACWTALERAGYAPSQMGGSVGVFGGATFNTYYLHALHQRPDLIELVGPEMLMFGNEKDYLTTRVAYKLGLKGPALNVSTACSTSLVAVAQACQSLLLLQCDVALAGGVSVTVPQQRGYYHDEGNIGSADGHTRTFDARATGTAFSNGVAIVVLKRLEDAVRDGDQIYAVIKGAGLNNDGSHRVSFGAPGVEGQADVIAMAHALAGVDPETITYVEAHGTATPLGDPIEVAGLTKAFRLSTDARQFCAIGSVKTNIGHLDAAAGTAGLIKTALAVHHGLIPATLHFETPNPKLDLETTPFYVNAALQPWKTAPGIPRRAGISSFGSGGTNAHLVLEQAPALAESSSSRPAQLLVLSAKTADALDRAAANLGAHLESIAHLDDPSQAARALADAAFTLQTGRTAFTHRRIVVARDAADGVTALEARDPKRVFTHRQQTVAPPVVFMFPGQGAQYPGMGSELYRSEPVFRDAIDRSVDVLRPLLDADLRDIMFPAAEVSAAQAADTLKQTRFTQPALFAIEYALAQLWMSWGIQPAAMIGHSVGEYVAGCLAGVFTLEDALSLVARRGALVQAQPSGAMLSVRLPESEVLPLLTPGLAIAAINSPVLCVVSGPHDAVAMLEAQLQAREVVTRHLHTSHAFHSPMMEPVLAPFADLLRQVPLGEPRIPYVSNVTADWITSAEATSPAYWAGHVRDTVRFADGIAELMKDARSVLLEVGPGQTLSTLARQHPSKAADQIVLASLPIAGDQESRGLLETLGRVWMAGVDVDWKAFYANERRRRVVLPTYPFERKRYWPDSPIAAETASNPTNIATAAPPTAGQESTTMVIPAATPALVAPQPSDEPRKGRILAAARSLVQELSGYDLSGVDPRANLLELGLDSLLLTQASQLFQRKFGVSITFRQLMEELGSLDSIADYLDVKLPPDAFAPVPAAMPIAPLAPASQSAAPLAPGSQTALLEQLLLQQMQLTNQVLGLLGRAPAAPASSGPAPALTVPPAASTATLRPPIEPEVKSHGPFRPIDRSAVALSPVQRHALDELIAHYTRRTAGSKRHAAEQRPFLADPRSAAGFKPLWKEMVYPIVTTRSDGSKVWDVDGHEYVDFVMGFGANMFGHRPSFLVSAVHDQLDLGFEIGPIQPLAAEVALLIRELTGMARVAFTNTGSEAVLAATRIARTVTGRDRIALFAGAYHGIFDEVLSRPLTINGELRSAPIAPGIPDSAVSQVIVLDYGNPQSLDILRARGSEIAAILVEPVQSRRLDLQPTAFLRELRGVATEIGAALVFDEVVTGFRVEPGGAQAYFGVRADLATYGKVIGGGISVGVVAGDPRFMDALDGGQWRYGDASSPEVGVTFFAGTFVRHPLALAAAKSVLTHLKEQGPELQQRLTARTAETAAKLRALIDEFDAPYQVTQFSSLIQVGFPADQRFAGLLFYLLRARGIHTYENRAFVMTTAHTDADLEKLTEAFRDSLAELQRGGLLLPSASTAIAARTPAIALSSTSPRQALVEPFPLTEAQKEIWLAAQMSQASAVGHNESLTFEFRGAFDPTLFRRAVQQAVERHPILLAGISEDGPTQRVRVDAALDVPIIDLTARADAEHELAALIEHEISEPFDFAAGPLLRVRIVALSSDRHVAIWTAHHVVCDGWSNGLLLSELATIYSALKKGVAPTLDEPVSFRDYALKAEADTDERRASAAYWRALFADLPAPLDLPADRPRPAVRTGRAATLKRTLASSLHQALKRTAGQQRTTLLVLLTTAFDALLYRLTGETDLVVGIPAAGQVLNDMSCLVGHCVNLLPVRTRLDASGTFAQAVAAVKTSVLDAYEHPHCTLGGILQLLKVPRSPSRPPLCEVSLNVDRDVSVVEFAGVELTVDRNAKRALHFDLFFNFVEGPRGLRVECDYNTDLFDADTIERTFDSFATLLEAITTDPNQPIATLSILPDDQRSRLLVEWNQTTDTYPDRPLIHQLVEKHAVEQPHALAVVCEAERLTWAELNGRANQLARHLARTGVTRGDIVALCLERSAAFVIALLAAHKAGAAYLPLDPTYPQERLVFLINDGGVRAVVTQSALASELSQSARPVVRLDADAQTISRESSENLAVDIQPEDLAYVIYTSGSTGQPKGVAIEHRQLLNYTWAVSERLALAAPASYALVSSVAADLGNTSLFPALATGGTLHVIATGRATDGTALAAYFAEHAVDVLKITPTHLASLQQQEPSRALLPRQRLVLGGEGARPAWVAELQRLAPDCTIVNHYGPTETTVGALTYRVTGDAAQIPGESLPIGRALGNVRAYVIDSAGEPAPIGVPGELFIAGAGVARGYLNRPELTAERFLPDPFAPDRSARMYRTGDRARWLADGHIEFLGRVDRQVKVRGFRVELGEIEAVLRSHPAVDDAIAMLREDMPGDRRLVAYVKTDATQALSEMRAHAKRSLPDYAVPNAFVAVEAWPLTSNGKLDHRALPAPADTRADGVGPTFVAPRTPIEQELAAMWRELLRVETVSAHDDFFDLGGHSLLAMRLFNRVHKQFGVALGLGTLFGHSALADMAALIERMLAVGSGDPSAPATAEPGRAFASTLGPRRRRS
jgi:amino acid adenylation domain-containing protein